MKRFKCACQGNDFAILSSIIAAKNDTDTA